MKIQEWMETLGISAPMRGVLLAVMPFMQTKDFSVKLDRIEETVTLLIDGEPVVAKTFEELGNLVQETEPQQQQEPEQDGPAGGAPCGPGISGPGVPGQAVAAPN